MPSGPIMNFDFDLTLTVGLLCTDIAPRLSDWLVLRPNGFTSAVYMTCSYGERRRRCGLLRDPWAVQGRLSGRDQESVSARIMSVARLIVISKTWYGVVATDR